MAFKMSCPKCGSGTYDIENHGPSFFGAREQTHFHCRICGKVIYGRAAIEAEAHRQLDIWNSNEENRVAAQAQEEANRREKEVVPVPPKPPRQPVSAGWRPPNRIAMSCTLGSCPTLVWVSPKQKAQIRATTKRVFCCPDHEEQWYALSKGQGHPCAWKDCSEPALPHSLYSSRDCSNKNARWRHGLRQAAQLKHQLDSQGG